MEPAAKILVVAGMVHYAYSCVIGFALSKIRLRMGTSLGTPDTGNWLPLAHRVSLWWGFMFLGMPWVLVLSPLASGVETLAAWLLVASSALSDIEPLLNQWQGVKDPVAERSLTFYLGGISAVLVTVGIGILTVGVIRAL